MLEQIKRFLSPPVFPDDEYKTRTARVLNTLILGTLALLIWAVAGIVFVYVEKLITSAIIITIFGLLLFARWLLRRGRVRLASVMFIATLWIAFTVVIFLGHRMRSPLVAFYVAVTVIAGTLLGPMAALIHAAISSLTGLGMVLIEASGTSLPVLFPTPARTGWFDLTLSLILAIVALDLTLRGLNEALARARRSESRFRTLVEQAGDAVFLADFDGRFLDVNRSACESVGYSREELLKLDVQDVAPNFDLQKLRALWSELEPGEPILLETVHRHRDGSAFPVEIRIGLLELEDQQLILGLARDITERRRAAEALREHAHRVEQILATVPAGVLLLGAQHQVLQTNPVADSDLVVLADAAVGDVLTHLGDRSLSELLAPPPKGLWHEVNAAGRTFEIIAQPMESAQGSPDGRASQGRGWVIVTNEVTQEREIQLRVQQQDRLAAVGQLAAGIAHDFNNIIAVIVLYAQMALNAPDLSPGTRKRMETVAQQAKQATALIQQILDFSRRSVIERRAMELTPLLKEIVKLLKRTMPENIQLNLSHGPGEHTVNADPTRIQQATLNLVVNARDAMPEGGELHIDLSRLSAMGDVKCGVCNQLLEGEWVRIAVTDTGTGISPDVLPYIFDPFFTTKPSGQGTGLGLAQVYGIVRQHKGHIDVITEVGQGTTFTIYLPALLFQQPDGPVTETEAIIKGQGETILLVEDNLPLRNALVDSLVALDYRVLEAANGRKALRILEKHAAEIDLVLSDLVMPEMGGPALFDAVRQRGLTVPVVILSGHPMEDELKSLQAQGLNGWMFKPPDMEQLSQRLAQILQKG